MQSVQLEQAIANIIDRDSRFHPGAFYLVKNSLDFTVQRISEQSKGEKRHISGAELILGFRDHLLQEYGPMAATLTDEWGLKKCADIGEIVFLLIEERVFGKQDSDSKNDFTEIYDFQEAFRAPFRPKKKAQTKQQTARS